MEHLNEKNHECCFMKPLTIVAIVLSSISILLSVFTLGGGMGRHRNDFHMQRPYGVQSEMRENYPSNNRNFDQKSNKSNRPRNFNFQDDKQNKQNRNNFGKPGNSRDDENSITPPSNNAPTVAPPVSPTSAPWYPPPKKSPCKS